MSIRRPSRPDAAPARSLSRRDALRLGGVSVSVAALVAACGEDRGGDTDPGRVGVAEPPEELDQPPVNDVVLLRTASSLELTAVEVYRTATGLGVFSGFAARLVDRLVADHEQVATEMGALTSSLGGTPWTSTNPWLMERVVAPVLEVIAESDDVVRDVVNFAISLENVASSTHQTLASTLSDVPSRVATVTAAALEARHAAALVIATQGPEAWISPAVTGEEVERDAGIIPQFAKNSRFGSLAQIELVVGAPDENGNRTTFLLSTPAENSFIYENMSDAGA